MPSDEPAFAVVPGTHRIPGFDPPDRSVPENVRGEMGKDYEEVPLLGSAGTV